MKRSNFILMGLLMLVTMLGLLFFSGAIYDAEKKHTIETFMFETNSQSKLRITSPVSADDIPDKILREMIVKRFVNEYFYVIPDSKNAEARLNFVNPDGTTNVLYGLSNKKILDYWTKTVAPEISKLADKRALRTVTILGFSESESGHLVVHYELKTWEKPNNYTEAPTVTRGDLLLDITRHPIHIEPTKEVLQWLENGEDPVAAFNFNILEVVQN